MDAGTIVEWRITETLRKVAVCRKPLGQFSNFGRRVERKLERIRNR